MQEEISLKELILILVRGWKLFVSITVFSVVATTVGLYLLNTTAYVGELHGKLIKVDQYDTVYGSFRPNYASLEEQLMLVNEVEFLNFINNEVESNGNISFGVVTPDGLNFTIQFSLTDSKNIESSLKFVQNNLEDYLNYSIQTSAIESFLKHIADEIERENRSIFIHQGYIDRFANKRDQFDQLLNANTIHPSYDMIQREITSFELAQLRSLERIEILERDSKTLTSFDYKDFMTYQEGDVKFDDISVNLNFDPEITISSVSRYNAPLMVVVSAVISAMLAIFVIFFINYWKST